MRSRTDGFERKLLAGLTSQGHGPLSVDTVMGGQVRLIQNQKGYRAGMDAVLLAAAIPAKAGERALDIGAAGGVVSLCLARRVPRLRITGIEIQPGLVALGRASIALNRAEDRVALEQGSILDAPPAFPAASFDHVFANPPFFESGHGPVPPAPTKGRAYVGAEATIADWVTFAIAMAKPRGTITFLFRADRIHDLIGHLHPRAGEKICFPVWPRKDKAATRIIIQARKGMHGATAIAPGLVLHGKGERYTRAAEAILRGKGALELWRYHHPARAG